MNVDEEKNRQTEQGKQPFTLLGDKVLVALIRTPASYGTGELQLLVPSIAREYMNIGVVHSISEAAKKVCKATPRDVVMVKPYKGQQVTEAMARNFDLDLKRHWMIYEGEDILAMVPTDFREGV
jgi:hypothetical protein